MKKHILLLGAVLALLPGLLVSQRSVVLIIADDLSPDYLGFYPEHADTVAVPQLRSLLAQGVLFTQCRNNPFCSSTRAAILTGRYGFRTGIGAVVSQGSKALDSSEYTLAQRIRDAAPGIGRAQIGKWHLSNPSPISNLKLPLYFGFQHFEGPFIGALPSYTNWTKNTNGVNSTVTTYATTEQVNNAISWLRAQGSKPAFLWLAFNAPHSPYHLPPADLHGYSGLSGTTQDIRAKPKAYFKAMVQAMDHEIGRLFDSLRSMNRLDSTDIIFIGDNGNSKQTAQISDTSRVKGTIYEYGIRVPLLISGPSVQAPGRIATSLVQAVDLFETIPSLLGISNALPPGIQSDGHSLLPILQAKTDSIRPWSFSEVFQSPSTAEDGKCIQTGEYKLMRFDQGQEALYHLSQDPDEQMNLLTQSMDSRAAQQYAYLCSALEQLTAGSSTCNSNGIPPAETAEPFQVFPNPVADILTVSGVAPKGTLQLLDLNGRVLMLPTAGNTFDVRFLSPGIYLLRHEHQLLRIVVTRD